MPLRLSLLGPPRVDVDGAALAVDTRKAVAVLARLALSGVQSRDVLAELLWPDYPADRSRAALRRTLSALRSGLGGRWLETDRGQVALTGADVWVDAAEFRSLAAAGGRRDLERAVALHRGDLLEGFGLRDSAAFDDWQRAEAAALRAELEAALDALVAALEADGRHQEAVAHARRRLALDPLHEPSHRALMRVLAASGHRAEALEQYRECVRTLDRELGVRPLPETAALYTAVSEGAPLPGPAAPAAVPQSAPAPALVGRAAELSRLRSEHAACAGGGRLVVVEGEAGVGKTRLCDELLAALPGGAVAVAARSHEGESGLPFGLAAAALRAALDAAGAERLAGIPGHWRAEAARLLPDVGTEPPPAAGGPAALQRLHEGLTQVLAALLDGDPAGVLVLDDLQFADPASLALVAYLARRLGGRRLLVVGAWRPEEEGPELAGLRRLAGHVVRLGRLRRAQVEELAAAAGASGRAGELFAETDGLPLFVVEYLAALGGDDDDVPGGVRALLASRLDRVGDTAAQLLAAAAVIGRSFDADTLRAASGRGEEETVAGLEELTRRGLIVEREAGYDFSHDRLLDVAYGRTSLARRRLLHRRTAAVLAEGHADPALVARHLEAAGRDAEAAEAYRAAGDHARDLHASEEALAAYAAALALGHPDAAGLHEAAGDQHTLRGEYRAALDAYESAAAMATQEVRRAAIEHKVGRVHDRRGDADLARRHLDEALRLGGETARVQADRSLAAHRRADDAEAVALARRALELGSGAGDAEAVAQAENILGMLTGDAAHLERAVDLAGALPDRGVLVAALNNLALARGRSGDPAGAIGLTERALAISVERGDRHREAALRNNLADLLHAAGREADAMEQLKQAVTIFAEIGADGDELQPEVWKLVEW